MNLSKAASPETDKYSARVLLRRLLVEEALGHWPRYAVAIVLSVVVAGATALPAYLIGTLVDAADVDKNYSKIVSIGVLTMLIFVVRGLATYGSSVLLSWIGNRIIADNQRRMFDKLLHENIGYFADRHSSEFVSRLATGAQAVCQVINILLITSGTRSSVADFSHLYHGEGRPDHVLRCANHCSTSNIFLAQNDPPRAHDRTHAVHRQHAYCRDRAGGAARHAHGQGFRPRRRDATASRRERHRGPARGQ